jgi:hypothetical protein
MDRGEDQDHQALKNELDSDMRLSFIAQPDRNLGPTLIDLLAHKGTPRRLAVVSAFASLTAVMRLKPYMLAVHASGGDGHLILGVDMGGTSQEVLREVSAWPGPVTIIKNRAGGVTFHPKIYHLIWDNEAHLFVGSNNLTDGGLFRNYEAATHVVFDMPIEAADHTKAVQELGRFLHPAGPTSRRLDPDYLEALMSIASIPSEVESRRRRQEAAQGGDTSKSAAAGLHAFGFEPPPVVPRLPPELQTRAIEERRRQRAEASRRARTLARETAGDEVPAAAELPPPAVQLDAQAFLMTLPRLRDPQGNTPGEVRIPLDALELAEDFWGWPTNYATVVSPRGGVDRVYKEWRAPWRVYPADNPASAVISPAVRLYFYQNSSDFRFYARQIVNLGANTGDIVRIRRVDEPEVTFDCAVALQGMPQWDEWNALCVNEAIGGRRFAFV